MKICFPSIIYIQHPFIWIYDQETNRAECTLNLAGTTTNYDKALLLECLGKFHGITIEDDVAVINDMATFIKTHPMMPLYEEKTPPLKRTISKPSSTFFSHSEKKASTTVSASSTDHCKGIRIENFLNQKNWPTEWGNTLSCLSYFTDKNKSDALTRSVDLVYSMYDLPINLQYKKNEKLYPIKQQQMEIICYLFNDVLAPLYDEIDEVLPTMLSAYLRAMVNQIMTNQRLNYGPTPTERLSSIERKEKFLDINEYEFAVHQEYIARVNVMLRGLLFFISPNMTATSLIQDEETAKRLELLRMKLNTSTKELFSEKLDCLRKLSIEAGKTEYRFDLLMRELYEKMERRSACIGNVYSCFNIIYKFLKEKLPKEKDALHISLADDTMALVIRALVDTYTGNSMARGHIGIPSTAHKDIYLSKPLEEMLRKTLEEKLIDLKVKKKELPGKLTEILMQLIEMELKAVLSPSNSTNSSESELVESFKFACDY
ncbi:hypothetical protein [Legionella clemsonensis]|uniref:Uncharacterized protein n=1 Tax=Legionella clemsonensis TaxID=1867846 RepID=A0A222P2B2_9GAMM|nr:hypothetical protein [Legionella clemsonensis]ASQ45961.1 hypothetical protein clem_07030 [Legionella clemsonensis]